MFMVRTSEYVWLVPPPCYSCSSLVLAIGPPPYAPQTLSLPLTTEYVFYSPSALLVSLVGFYSDNGSVAEISSSQICNIALYCPGLPSRKIKIWISTLEKGASDDVHVNIVQPLKSHLPIGKRSIGWEHEKIRRTNPFQGRRS